MAIVILLGGCGSMQQPDAVTPSKVSASSVMASSSYQQLYLFHPRVHGVHPEAGLMLANGVLYGTTERGGAFGKGTVYSVTTGGAESVLYSFRGGSDGSFPMAGLSEIDGTLYGTTYRGGSANDGTVYSVTTAGTEKVLYSFTGGDDGSEPEAGLLAVKGVLYGTTSEGGGSGCIDGCGTVFRITPSGHEKVLHRFGGGGDGQVPLAGLVAVKDVFYGTTNQGGDTSVCHFTYTAGCGTVYTITPGGLEKVVYDFTGGSAGELPAAGVTPLNGILYGTTSAGGLFVSNRCGGCGTVYSLSAKGVEKVLHLFASNSDGAQPDAALIAVNGTLYGTTAQGGYNGRRCVTASGCGTLYSITSNGTENVLYRFVAGRDGSMPQAPLLDVNGTAYGTTASGGYDDKCCVLYGYGTIFTLSLASK